MYSPILRKFRHSLCLTLFIFTEQSGDPHRGTDVDARGGDKKRLASRSGPLGPQRQLLLLRLQPGQREQPAHGIQGAQC